MILMVIQSEDILTSKKQVQGCPLVSPNLFGSKSIKHQQNMDRSIDFAVQL